MLRFNPAVEHVPGKTLLIADALSRSPLPHNDKDVERAEEIEAHVDAIQSLWPVSSEKLQYIKEATANDSELHQLTQFTSHGWPRVTPPELRNFECNKSDLSLQDGLLLFRDRIVIPSTLRKEMLGRLHETHQGFNKCLENAQGSIWWPGMAKELKEFVDKCATCKQTRPTQRARPPPRALTPATVPPLPPSPPWRSQRNRRPPRRLIEEM